MIPFRSGLSWGLIATLTALSSWSTASSGQLSAATVVALEPGVTAGVGAPLDFAEYEAENGATNAHIVGPDDSFTTLAAEASGRRAVLLETERDFVEFALSAPANALTVRYAVPDGPDEGITDSTLSIYAKGKRIAVLPVTSRYCCYYGRYPFTKNAADGSGHHFYSVLRCATVRFMKIRTISQRELRNQSAAVLREVEAGRTIIVSRNGTPVGELRPIKRRRFVPRATIADAAGKAARIDAAQFRADLDAVVDPHPYD